MIETSRRSLITGLISLIAAPAIIRAGSLMPVKTMLPQLGPLAAFELSREQAYAGQIEYRSIPIGNDLAVWIYDGYNWIKLGD